MKLTCAPNKKKKKKKKKKKNRQPDWTDLQYHVSKSVGSWFIVYLLINFNLNIAS